MIGRKKTTKQDMKRADLLQGTLDMLILKALTAGATHGYGIAQRIEQASEEMLKIEEGSLYPALYRLVARGWVSSDWRTTENNRSARYYALTRAGRKQLTAETKSWARTVAMINRMLEGES